MDCVLLAGGLGTRMRPLTARMPKNLLPVLGEPFAAHQLDLLAGEGVRRVIYCIGHMGEAVRDYVGDGSRWGLSVAYADEGEELQGTAGALRVAHQAGLLPDEFLVLYGDSYLPSNYRDVWNAFQQSGAPALMTVFRNEGRWETSNVLYQPGEAMVYDKRRTGPRAAEMRHVDYGLSVLKRSVIEDYVPPTGKADLADVFERLSREGRLAAYEVAQRFYEIGSPAGLADLEDFLERTRTGREVNAGHSIE